MQITMVAIPFALLLLTPPALYGCRRPRRSDGSARVPLPRSQSFDTSCPFWRVLAKARDWPRGKTSVRPTPFILPLRSEDDTVVRIGSLQSRAMRSIEQVGSLPVCLSVWRSACRATCSPALRTHALLPGIRFRASARCGLLPQSKFGAPSTDSVHSPREEVGDGTPSGQACTADSGHNQKKRSPTPCSTKSSSSADSVRMQKPKPLRITVSSSSSTSPPRKAGRTIRANTRPAPNGTASMPGGISRSSPKTLQKGQLVTLEGTLKYRDVEDDVEGTTFKHRIAEIHATSLKRLSRIEAADDPTDAAGDE